MQHNIIKLSNLVLPAYREMFKTDKTYIIVKGSRASGKSKACSLYVLYQILKYPLSNALCVRSTLSTLKDSCFADIKFWIYKLGISHLFKFTLNPLEMTYLPTGQRILFRGCDDPVKLTSISVPIGIINICWFEEFFQCETEEMFDLIDESIRGELPKGYRKRILGSFNPWQCTWIKERFFDIPDNNTFSFTTTYKDNPYLSSTDLALFERMKEKNPKRYKVAGLGEFGIAEGLIYENWEVQDLTDMIPTFSNIYWGCDFGVVDPNTIVGINVDMGQKKIYVFDEFYQSNITLDILADEMRKRIGNSFITCDSAGAQQILELNNRGVWALPAQKGAGSVIFGIQWLQEFDIIIHKDCKNLIREISSYRWAVDKFDNPLNKPVDGNDHVCDALRYACNSLYFSMSASAARRL